MAREGILSRGRIGRAEVRLVRAGDMLDHTVRLLKRDELALVRRRAVDLWSLAGAIRIAVLERATLRLLYYVSEEARVVLEDRKLRAEGVEMRAGPHVLEELTLRLPAEVEPLRMGGQPFTGSEWAWLVSGCA